jgi:hypothetical protein
VRLESDDLAMFNSYVHHSIGCDAVKRTDYQIMDIDNADTNDDGSIASLVSESGDTLDDLRVPDDEEYKGLREAVAAGTHDIIVSVVEAVGIRKILPNYISKVRARSRIPHGTSPQLHTVFFFFILQAQV